MPHSFIIIIPSLFPDPLTSITMLLGPLVLVFILMINRSRPSLHLVTCFLASLSSSKRFPRSTDLHGSAEILFTDRENFGWFKPSAWFRWNLHQGRGSDRWRRTCNHKILLLFFEEKFLEPTAATWPMSSSLEIFSCNRALSGHATSYLWPVWSFDTRKWQIFWDYRGFKRKSGVTAIIAHFHRLFERIWSSTLSWFNAVEMSWTCWTLSFSSVKKIVICRNRIFLISNHEHRVNLKTVNREDEFSWTRLMGAQYKFQR